MRIKKIKTQTQLIIKHKFKNDFKGKIKTLKFNRSDKTDNDIMNGKNKLNNTIDKCPNAIKANKVLNLNKLNTCCGKVKLTLGNYK